MQYNYVLIITYIDSKKYYNLNFFIALFYLLLQANIYYDLLQFTYIFVVPLV